MTKRFTEVNCWTKFFVMAFLPFMFFISLIVGFLNIIPFDVAIHSLIIIGFILFIFLIFIAHNATYSACIMDKLKDDLERDIEDKLEKNILKIEMETKSILDIDQFLEKYYKDIRNRNFVSVAPSIFPMLGILGTFIAISISMPDFIVTDVEALDKEISLLLSSVGSAFYSSIYGVFLSLLWIYFEKQGLAKVDNYSNRIKENFEDKIWTEDELTIYRYTQYDLKENRFLAALEETFNSDLLQTISNNNMSKIKDSMDEMNSSFTDISTKLNESSLNLINALHEVDNSKTAVTTRNQIDKSLIEFTDAMKRFERSTRSLELELKER